VTQEGSDDEELSDTDERDDREEERDIFDDVASNSDTDIEPSFDAMDREDFRFYPLHMHYISNYNFFVFKV
jgi:hypothetical protein